MPPCLLLTPPRIVLVEVYDSCDVYEGDITFLVCHVSLRDHVTKGLRELVNENRSH